MNPRDTPVAPVEDIRLEDVHKCYPMGREEVKALAGVNASFRRGEFCAILGASGSGKSTLLNLLGCLDRPTRGRYLLAGQDVSAMTDNQLSDFRLRHLGFVFQSFNLIAQSTVEENIQLPLYYQGLPAREGTQRARDLAARVGLESRLRHKPSELSGGQQQRVAIARALANDPTVVLADEPTGNLDSRTGREIMDLLAEVNGQGRTVLLVTHEPQMAAYARRRLYMKDGLIEREEGDTPC